MFATRERIRVTIEDGWLAPGALPAVAEPRSATFQGSEAAAPPNWIAEAAHRPLAPKTVVVGRTLAWRRILAVSGAAAIVSAFGALVVHTYVMSGPISAATGVPLIKADLTPWRIKPAEEGGMVVPNQDRLVLQDLGASAPASTVRGFLPPPEAPMPRPTLASIAGGGASLTVAAAAPVSAAEAVEILIEREEETQQGSVPASAETAAMLAAVTITPTIAPPIPAPPPTPPADVPRPADPPAEALVSTLAGADDLALLIDLTGPAPASASATATAGAVPPVSLAAPTNGVLGTLPGTVVAGLGPAPVMAAPVMSMGPEDPWPAPRASATLPPIAVSTEAGPVGGPVLPAGIAPAFAAIDAPVGAITPTQASLPVVAPAADGGYAVQLAAVSSEAEVTIEWDRFRRRYPDIFGRLELRVKEIEGATRLGFRVQAGPLDAATAQAVCRALVNEKTGCLVVGG